MKRFIFLVGLALLACGGLVFFLQAKHEEEAPQVAVASPEEPLHVAAQGIPFPPPGPELDSGQPAQDLGRVQAESAVLHGLVLSPDGGVVPGAVVTWTAWSPKDLEWEPAWQADDWGWLGRQTLETKTDGQGSFSFDQELGNDQGSMLWATHERFTAGCLLVPPGNHGTDPARIPLGQRASMRVRVVDAAGNPVPGAVIEHFGLTPHAAMRGTDGRTEERARRLLQRRYQADAQGLLAVGSFPGEQVLVASHGNRCTAPWRGVAREEEEVVLRLQESFTVAGTASFPDWTHLDYEGERRLLIEADAGGQLISLASIRRIQEGAFGPIELPCIEDALYTLKLEGSPIIPVFEDFPTPPAGAQLSFDLVAELGHALWFVAQDEEGEILFDAEVACYYEHDGRERVLRRRARAEDGYICPYSFPEGAVVRSFISAPGYGGVWADTLVVPESDPGTHPVVLRPGASLRGRCTHGGEPLDSFEVVIWEPGRSRFTQQARKFRGRPDGTFVMDGIPAGAIAIAASTSSLPQCEPVHLSVPTEQEVVLDLQAPLGGRGIVVDLQSGQPIPDAKVQVFVMGTEGPLRPWGPLHGVDHQGRFEILGFVPGENAIHVRAPAYSEREVQATSRESSVDFGTVALSRPQTLELRLVADAPVDFTAYAASATAPIQLPTRQFDSSGVVRYEGVSAGSCVLYVETARIPWTALALELVPGKPWVFSHKVAGARSLTIEVVAPEGDDLSRYRGLLVSYLSRSGILTESGIPMPAGDTVVVDGIDAENVEVSILDPNLGIAATVGGSFEAEEELHVRLDLGGSPFTVRVVDEEGEPVPGVFIRITDAGDAPMLLRGTTDGAGECRIRGVPERDILLHLEHATLGRRYGVRVDGAVGAAEVTLTSECEIDLRCKDGDQPLQGIVASVREAAMNKRLETLGTSDVEGRIHATGLGQGTCRLAFEHPGCWPVTREVQATKHPAPTEVQIRRLGGVAFQVRSPEGLPVGGQRIDLRSVEFETDVADWIAAGLVDGPDALVSGLDGLIRVERVPRGTYRWVMSTPAGETLEGLAEVPPADVLSVPIVLPPP